MLLGDTIIIDNLDAANHYRKEVCFNYSLYFLKQTYCMVMYLIHYKLRLIAEFNAASVVRVLTVCGSRCT